MKFSVFWGFTLLGLSSLVLAQPDSAYVPQGELTAGRVTVFSEGVNAFSFPFANLDRKGRTRFAIGNSFFNRNWVQAPASTTGRDGLGPHFIGRSCGACHTLDGRGRPPEQENGLNVSQPVGLLIRLSIEPEQPSAAQLRERFKHGVISHEVYGDQFNNAAIPGVLAEGQVRIVTRQISAQYPDGQSYTLSKPFYELDSLGYGPTGGQLHVSPRVAPQLAGVGLLEAIAEESILSNEAEQARTDGPIKGKVNWVYDPVQGSQVVGRYGWKANVGSLKAQTAGAFRGDIGITSKFAPSATCTLSQKDCLKAPNGNDQDGVEISERILNEVVFYQATLAPAARREVNEPAVMRGEQLFHQAQCAACHTPSYTTSEVSDPELTSQDIAGIEIWPYTDLLLHDMGEGLADHRSDFQANGRQWKTPPLWGIGLISAVNGHQRLLHDGRADGVEEAILWHGGEAQQSKDTFTQFSAADRQALIQFVNSL